MRDDPRIVYIRRNKNWGNHTRPKNDGSKAAKADLIAYFDDDNYMLPSHMQVLWKYINETSSDVVYGDSILIDETGQSMPRMAITSDINEPNSINIFERNFIDTNQVIVKKKWIEKIGGWDETLPRFADWNLFTRLYKAGAVFWHAPIVITEYHVHPGSMQLKSNYMPDVASAPIWPDKTLYGKRPELKVAVYTLTKDRLEYTKRMMSALHLKTQAPFDHFVVDNGSTDGTKDYLKELEGQTVKSVIYNEQNVGISKGSNQALDLINRTGKYDIIIKVDNDIEVWNPAWLEQALDLYKRYPKVVSSPIIEGLIDNPGGSLNRAYQQIGMHLLGITHHIGGAFCIAPAQAYSNFRWREDDYLHSNQDWVFSQHCLQDGYVLAYFQTMRAEHIDTTAGQKQKFKEYFKLREKERLTRYAK